MAASTQRPRCGGTRGVSLRTVYHFLHEESIPGTDLSGIYPEGLGMPSLLVEDNVGLATKHGSVSTITRPWEFRLREDHEEHSL